MSTMPCSKCGTSLAAGAKSCPSCGQVVAAGFRPASPAPASASASAKRLPVAALAVLGGGLIVLLGAVTLYRSGALSGTGGTTTPGAATPAAQPATPASTIPETSVPGAPASPAAPAPAIPGASAPGAASLSTPASPVPGSSVPGAASLSTPAPPVPGSSAPVRTPLAPAPAAVPAPTAQPAPPLPPVEKTYECRESAVFNVSPEETILTVDGEVIGIVDEWDDMAGGRKYKFKGEGIHYVKLSHRGQKTIWLKFVVSDHAEHKTANVELALKEK